MGHSRQNVKLPGQCRRVVGIYLDFMVQFLKSVLSPEMENITNIRQSSDDYENDYDVDDDGNDDNSIQFRHLNATANEHHVCTHGEKKATLIKYMNKKRKKINQLRKKWDFGFVLKKWSERPGSRKSAGSEFYTADNKTLKDPVSFTTNQGINWKCFL